MCDVNAATNKIYTWQLGVGFVNAILIYSINVVNTNLITLIR